MKYIKAFEKEGDKFKIGTWVLLEIDNDSPWTVYPYVKIINRESTMSHNDEDEEPLNDYEVETFSLKNGKTETFWVDDFDIDRKLTNREIKDVQLKIDAMKYNL